VCVREGGTERERESEKAFVRQRGKRLSLYLSSTNTTTPPHTPQHTTHNKNSWRPRGGSPRASAAASSPSSLPCSPRTSRPTTASTPSASGEGGIEGDREREGMRAREGGLVCFGCVCVPPPPPTPPSQTPPTRPTYRPTKQLPLAPPRDMRPHRLRPRGRRRLPSFLPAGAAGAGAWVGCRCWGKGWEGWGWEG
jgi:hypothetical protein